MRYHWFRQCGLFTGSGVVEASCKTVVGQRLKQSGMHWTVSGARHHRPALQRGQQYLGSHLQHPAHSDADDGTGASGDGGCAPARRWPPRDLVGGRRGRPGLRYRLWPGAPSALADAGLGFSRLEAVFLTHLHAGHIGDLPGLLLYGWGTREGDEGPLPPIRVYGPPRPDALPDSDAAFHRETTIHPERPAPGTADLVDNLLVAYAYHSGHRR